MLSGKYRMAAVGDPVRSGSHRVSFLLVFPCLVKLKPEQHREAVLVTLFHKGPERKDWVGSISRLALASLFTAQSILQPLSSALALLPLL